jgi:hypothetical protein
VGSAVFADASRSGKKEILRLDFLKLWAPTMKLVALKREQMMARGVLSEAHTVLCDSLKAETNLARIEEILEDIATIQDDTWQKSQPHAFHSVANSREELFIFQMAADFHDAWTEITSSVGRTIRGFCAFYIDV